MAKSLHRLWANWIVGLGLLLSSTAYANECIMDCFRSGNFWSTVACGQWSLDTDTLYWTTCEHGLMYGSETDAFASGSDISYETKKKHPHSRWDLGWRLGLSYQFPCECWDATLLWTHFDTDLHASRDEFVSPSQFFTPAWGGIPGNGSPSGALLGRTSPFPVQEASAHWKLRLNLVDLEIGREFSLNSCLTLRPHVGIRGGSINEKNHLEYEVIALVGEPGSLQEVVTDEFHLENDFEGAGVRGGLETDYEFDCGITIYGNIAAALLFGEREIKTKELLNAAANTIAAPLFSMNQKDIEDSCQAITDAEIGIRWQYCCCNKILTFQLGWEHHFFFNQNKFEKFTNYAGTNNFATERYPQVVHGDLSIQGLVLSTRVRF